jgi:glycosyltransferase involved in cell wall biosynthesis
MRILHVFRTPVGGLFRHVRDLVRGQTDAGHRCGIVCDSTTGGEGAAKLLAGIAERCELGIARIAISRLPGLGDFAAARRVAEIATRSKPDIVHCHGAKGGLFGRLAARRLRIPSVYTPHGGSLHFEWSSPSGAAFLTGERLMRQAADGFIFVCEFERDAFAAKLGLGGKPHVVVHNGLWAEEFAAVPLEPGAAEIVYLGELRRIKGTDILIEALRRLRPRRAVRCAIVGDGEDRAAFEAQAAAGGLSDTVRFLGAMPARQALGLGRVFVLPSRAESFPYAVLEAVAAEKPILASRVGGLPEILPELNLFAPGDPLALANAIDRTLANIDDARAQAKRLALAARQRFGADLMNARIMEFYGSLRAG